MSDCNSGEGSYEVIHPMKATTHTVYVYENGDIYDPEGEIDKELFLLASARDEVHKLVQEDEIRQRIADEVEKKLTDLGLPTLLDRFRNDEIWESTGEELAPLILGAIRRAITQED